MKTKKILNVFKFLKERRIAKGSNKSFTHTSLPDLDKTNTKKTKKIGKSDKSDKSENNTKENKKFSLSAGSYNISNNDLDYFYRAYSQALDNKIEFSITEKNKKYWNINN